MKLMILMSLVFSLNVFAKRVAPPKVNPVNIGHLEFSTTTEKILCENKKDICGMTAFLISTDTMAKSAIWKTQLYIKMFKKNEETDVQEIYPQSLILNVDSNLQLKDEKGTEYLVEAKSGKFVKPLKTVIY
jgi:hypothetical protein